MMTQQFSAKNVDPLALVDAHLHIDDVAFAPDRAAVLARAREVGIKKFVVAGYLAKYWPRLRRVCAQYPAQLVAAYGLHPLYLEEHQISQIAQLETWLEQAHAVAVGECGLDYYVPGLDPKRQQWFFIQQLAIAANAGLPVVVHARKAVEEVSLLLKKYPGLRGVVHSFAGSLQQAQRLVDAGFLLSFGGPITYPRAHRLRAIVQALPLDALLLETDAPDQPLYGYQGMRNEPMRLGEILTTVARLRDELPSVIAAATTANAQRLFAL